jgi:hypothetical protein
LAVPFEIRPAADLAPATLLDLLERELRVVCVVHGGDPPVAADTAPTVRFADPVSVEQYALAVCDPRLSGVNTVRAAAFVFCLAAAAAPREIHPERRVLERPALDLVGELRVGGCRRVAVRGVGLVD